MLWKDSELANILPLEASSTSNLLQSTDLLQPTVLFGSRSSSPHTIAFVDTRVDDFMTVMADLQSDIKVLLDPTRDGIDQITETLSHYKDITGIDIVSHGNVAELQLGNSSLSANSLPQYAAKLQQWETSLAPGADILLYGCNVAVGEEGKTFVNDLHGLTGADVAASTDSTGNFAKGGDWTLEYTTGSIETPTPFTDSFLGNYQSLLPTLFTTQTPVETNTTDGVGSNGDYELGMEFRSVQPGQISAIRYYKAPSETNPHTGRIWSSTGQLLASVPFANETASGWQQQALTSPLTIAANTTYVVSVNANSYYTATRNGLATTITNGNLSAIADGSNGVYSFTPGLFPTESYQNSNYFRDIVFAPNQPTSNNPGTVTVTGTATEDQTLTATVADVDGLTGVTIAYQWQQFANNSWTDIAGATNQTLTLGDAQVNKQVRARATYTDVLGSSENPISNATAAVTNINDLGTVAISGIAAAGNTLTAAVTDADGLTGVTVNYQWQRFANNVWSNVAGATNQTLALDSSYVGQQVRVNAIYTDALGGSENILSSSTGAIAAAPPQTQTLFTTQTPVETNTTDGVGSNGDYELGMEFRTSKAKLISAIRYYKAPSETGSHTGRIWSSTGQLLASVPFVNETASGWQEQSLTTPLTIQGNTTYVVSVNANSYYAVTYNGLASTIANGDISAVADGSNGVYNPTPTAFPTQSYQNSNYFRDIVVSESPITALSNNATIYASEATGFATVTVARTGSNQERMTLEYTTNQIVGTGVAEAGTDYIQPTLDGRANTGQVVFEIGETEKTFTIPIVNDTLIEENETFAVGLQNPSLGNLGAPRTVLVAIVDDDSPSTISVSETAVNVSEGVPTATVTIQRSGSQTGSASIDFATSNGTAIAGSDYTATSGTITFDAGQVTRSIEIPLLSDLLIEGNESFTVTLSNPTGGAILGSQATSTITILDDDLNLGDLIRQPFVSGLNQPTTLDWTPDGRYMLVAEKGGVVRVIDNGTLRSTPLIDLSNQVNNTVDRGLLGIAVHPNFANTPYVYLLHTYDPPEAAGGTGQAGPDGSGNRPSRLVRLTVNPTTMVADPLSLVVLAGTNSTWAYTSRPDIDSTGDVDILPSGIVNGTTITAPASQIDVGNQDNDPNHAGIQNQNIRDYLATDSNSHSIGAVHFGPDGLLYLSNGDGTSYNFVDPRAVRVQDINNLSGKVLRIDPISGEGVPSNPFFDANNPNSNRSKVFYSGIRNGFRFTFDPVTNLPVVGDVGWGTWEEIDTGSPGSNFGWPYLEGPNQTASYNALPQAIAFYANGNRNNIGDPAAVFPILSRSHGAPDFASAIMAGEFFNFNTLIFGDVIDGTLYAATLDPITRQVTSVQIFDSGIPYLVDMEMGPDGRLYGVNLATGDILRWNPAT